MGKQNIYLLMETELKITICKFRNSTATRNGIAEVL